MLRALAVFISTFCILPLLWVLLAWVYPFSVETQSNWTHVVQTLLSDYVIKTLLLCFGVALFSALFGVGSAWLISTFDFVGKNILQWALILPLAIPAYISAYSYGWLLEYAGPLQSGMRQMMSWQRGDYSFFEFRSLGGSIFILGLATTPYVYLLSRTAFRSQPREWWEAAASLGHSQASFFWRVALPAARPFVATGVALALMETVADIGTVTVMGIPTLGAGIYRSWFYLDEPLVAARLAGLLLIFVFVLMLIESLGRKGVRYSSLRQSSAGTVVRLCGWRGIVVFLLSSLPVLLGFLIPVLILLRLLSYARTTAHLGQIWSHVGDTLYLGVGAGVLAVTAAFIMVCAERFHKSWMRVVVLVANLGYAIPGAVIAVGLMVLFTQIKDLFSGQFILTGSLWGLFAAFTVRFLATAFSPIHSGMQRIPAELDMAAASLGKSRAKMIFLVHAPLLGLSLAAAFIVVFLDTVKELPATLILRPFDVKPLAVAAFEFASDDRHVEAAPFSLVLIFFSALAVILLHGIQEKALRWHSGKSSS